MYKEHPKTKRSVYGFTHLSAQNSDFQVYNNTILSLVKAVKERVFYVKKNETWVEPHRPRLDTVNHYLAPFFFDLKKVSTSASPMEAEHYVQLYHGSRRQTYELAMKENKIKGFDARTSHVTIFLKYELYDFHSKIPVQRVISPRDARYRIEAGRYIRPLEKLIYDDINTLFKQITVFKCLNAVERGEVISTMWDLYLDPVAIGLDAHRFDQHVSNAMLEWEHTTYQLYYKIDKFFKFLMKLQRNNVCKGFVKDGKVKYTSKHGRMSGDPNTSLGNVLIMCGIIYSFMKTHSIELSLANDGDDCVIITERSNLDKIINLLPLFFEDLGFSIVVEDPVYELEHIEFCQCKPVLDGNGKYRMVRNPFRSIAKDSIAKKPLTNEKIMRRWAKTVGQGGLSLNSSIPVMQSFYSVLDRVGGDHKILTDEKSLDGGLFRLGKRMEPKIQYITEETRFSFWKAFGVLPDEQVAIEDHYKNYILGEGSVHDRYADLPIYRT